MAITPLDTIKLVENPLSLTCRDTYPLVGDLEDDRWSLTPRADTNTRLRWRLVSGIL